MDQVILAKLITDLKGMGTLTPSGEKLTTLKGLYDTLTAAITQVELISKDVKDGLDSSDKKGFVVAIVDAFVKIPFIPEWLLNDFVSYGIDLVISFLNTKLGTNWINAMPVVTPPAA